MKADLGRGQLFPPQRSCRTRFAICAMAPTSKPTKWASSADIPSASSTSPAIRVTEKRDGAIAATAVGSKPRWEIHYDDDEIAVREFVAFLKGSGGFEIC